MTCIRLAYWNLRASFGKPASLAFGGMAFSMALATSWRGHVVQQTIFLAMCVSLLTAHARRSRTELQAFLSAIPMGRMSAGTGDILVSLLFGALVFLGWYVVPLPFRDVTAPLPFVTAGILWGTLAGAFSSRLNHDIVGSLVDCLLAIAAPGIAFLLANQIGWYRGEIPVAAAALLTMNAIALLVLLGMPARRNVETSIRMRPVRNETLASLGWWMRCRLRLGSWFLGRWGVLWLASSSQKGSISAPLIMSVGFAWISWRDYASTVVAIIPGNFIAIWISNAFSNANLEFMFTRAVSRRRLRLLGMFGGLSLALLAGPVAGAIHIAVSDPSDLLSRRGDRAVGKEVRTHFRDQGTKVPRFEKLLAACESGERTDCGAVAGVTRQKLVERVALMAILVVFFFCVTFERFLWQGRRRLAFFKHPAFWMVATVLAGILMMDLGRWNIDLSTALIPLGGLAAFWTVRSWRVLCRTEVVA